MDCPKAGTLLIAFHDGELDGPVRGEVEAHLRECPRCAALLADLARADGAAGVPDPGPAYWDSFNARVAERIAREAGGEKAAVLRPKRGWARQQLRYFVPAVAAAALVVVFVRHAGLDRAGSPASFAPPEPAVPAEIARPAAPIPEPPPALPAPGKAVPPPETVARAEAPPPVVATPPPAEPSIGRMESNAPESATRDLPAPSPPPAALPDRSSGSAFREERFVGEESPAMGVMAAPGAAGLPQPRAERAEAAASRLLDETARIAGESSMRKQRSAKSMAAAMEEGKSSPCREARMLAARGRLAEAEAAQRACLEEEKGVAAQEAGLVFLAELLDRQDRFAEADAVLENATRQFPRSRPLDLYRQQRPMIRQNPLPSVR